MNNAQPLYTTKADHIQQGKRKRRRIGEMSDRLKNELQAMNTNDRTRAKIAVAMMLINL